MHTVVASVGGPLLATLLGLGTGMSRTRLKQLLAHGAILVNGNPVTQFDHPLQKGDRVSFGRGGVSRQGPSGGVRILHEDDDVIVADKPAGLLTVATDKERDRTAYRYLNDYLAGRGRVYIVHRLDRDTSGVLVFAKTEDAKRRLQDRWAETTKKYWAVVRGVPAKKSGKIESHLAENTAFRVYGGERSEESKLAVTRYEVKKSSRRAALLDVAIDTGRKHQIRVQLAEIGHPVLGDETYGDPKDKTPRLALHARLLTFPHPVTGEFLTFESPLPPALENLV